MSEALEAEVKKLLRVKVVEYICRFNNDEIDKLCGDLRRIDRLYDDVGSIVQQQHDNLTKTQIKTFIDSVIGNMPKCAADLRDALPSTASMAKLEHFNEQWKVNQVKSKRASIIDTQDMLSKRARKEMDSASMSIAPKEGLPASSSQAKAEAVHLGLHLARTKNNHQASITIGFPPNLIKYGRVLGKGSFGQALLCTIDGVSYLPAHNQYVAKKFTGTPRSQFKSFGQESSIDLSHRGIVRAIAHTNSDPWVLVFPFFNAGTLGEWMELVPAPKGTLSTFLAAGDETYKKRMATVAETQRLSVLVKYAPSIIHALVQTLQFAHDHGVLHNDLHPWNVVIDITKEGIPRVGLIDWGLALRVKFEKRPSNVVDRKEHDARPWRAEELCDARSGCPYSYSTDTFALVWLIQIFCTTCEEYASHYGVDWAGRAQVEVQTIKSWTPDYLKKVASERKSLKELNDMLTMFDVHPEQCLRPMMEMMPAFI